MTAIPPPARLAITVLAVAALSGCSSAEPASDAAGDAALGCPITMSDGWVKAAPKDMTALFGTLTNTAAEAVTVTGGSTSAATTVELHEIVESDGGMVMQPAAGGFTVPADGTVRLEPGGRHLMLMGLLGAIASGDDVTVTLQCADGGTAAITAQAKAYTGADETYDDSADSPMPSRS